jgi:hypothetical protein
MSEGAGQERWSHTSAVLCLMYNQNRPKGKPEAKPADFDPYEMAARKEKSIASKESLELLRDTLTAWKGKT